MTNKLCLFVAASGILGLLPPSASASMQLTLQSGATTVIVNDNGAGDNDPTTGIIAFRGAVGRWTFNVTTGFIGTNPIIDLNSISRYTVGSSCAGNPNPCVLTLKLSGTDFTEPFNSTFSGNIGGTVALGHTLTYSTYANTNNLLGATQTLIGAGMVFGPGTAGHLSFGGSVFGGGVNAHQLYSLTQVVTIDSGNKSGGTSFNGNIDVVPEPATMGLLSGVLLLTGQAMRRKLRRP